MLLTLIRETISVKTSIKNLMVRKWGDVSKVVWLKKSKLEKGECDGNLHQWCGDILSVRLLFFRYLLFQLSCIYFCNSQKSDVFVAPKIHLFFQIQHLLLMDLSGNFIFQWRRGKFDLHHLLQLTCESSIIKRCVTQIFIRSKSK